MIDVEALKRSMSGGDRCWSGLREAILHAAALIQAQP